jgi:hypothetical protein
MLTQCSTSTPRNALSRRHSASISACGAQAAMWMNTRWWLCRQPSAASEADFFAS